MKLILQIVIFIKYVLIAPATPIYRKSMLQKPEIAMTFPQGA